MTSIKPPGGPSGIAPNPADVGGASGTQKSQGAGEAWKEALDKAGGAEKAAGGAPAEATKAAGFPAQVAGELKAGRIDVDTAVDRLVEHAMKSPHAQALTPAGKAELESYLRDHLAEDPALKSLVSELGEAKK